jgi:pentose-5-phosphate-3-epimerase
MIEIIPAIMPTSFPDFQEKLELVKGLVSTVQIDVMDGKFERVTEWPVCTGSQRRGRVAALG